MSPAARPPQTDRLRLFCQAMAALPDGEAVDGDEVLMAFADEVALAQRLGLIDLRSGWHSSILLTPYGFDFASELRTALTTAALAAPLGEGGKPESGDAPSLKLIDRSGYALWFNQQDDRTRSIVLDLMNEARAEESSVEAADGLDMPLPCDVEIAHIRYRKGVKLRTLVNAAARWHALASAACPLPTPVKMMVDPEWLSRKVEGDPDFDTDAAPAEARSEQAEKARHAEMLQHLTNLGEN